mgnify:CR=1 FL=1
MVIPEGQFTSWSDIIDEAERIHSYSAVDKSAARAKPDKLGELLLLYALLFDTLYIVVILNHFNLGSVIFPNDIKTAQLPYFMRFKYRSWILREERFTVVPVCPKQ